MFIPIWRNDPIWRAYFSNGSKPPTRFVRSPNIQVVCDEKPLLEFFRLVGLAIKQREVAKWHDGFGPVWKARLLLWENWDNWYPLGNWHILPWEKENHLQNELFRGYVSFREGISLKVKVTKYKGYCWWKKSCTTWNVWNPVNNAINYLSNGAEFLPSTVFLWK